MTIHRKRKRDSPPSSPEEVDIPSSTNPGVILSTVLTLSPPHMSNDISCDVDVGGVGRDRTTFVVGREVRGEERRGVVGREFGCVAFRAWIEREVCVRRCLSFPKTPSSSQGTPKH